MRAFPPILALLASVLCATHGAQATSLRVAPTSIALVAPDSASALSLTNDDQRAINVQIRVFRWTQVDGADRLEPTRDVVASPPAAKLRGGASTTIRVVRVSKTPVGGEESYRLVVDELPDPSRPRAGAVALVLRYSIPVFFTAPEASPPDVLWSVQPAERGLNLTGRNNGERHVRIADLALKGRGAKRVSLGEGLAGYVLGRSTMRWRFAGGSAQALSGRSVAVTAKTEAGPIDAVAKAR